MREHGLHKRIFLEISVCGSELNGRRAGFHLISCTHACSVSRLGIINVYNESVIAMKHVPPTTTVSFLLFVTLHDRTSSEVLMLTSPTHLGDNPQRMGWPTCLLYVLFTFGWLVSAG